VGVPLYLLAMFSQTLKLPRALRMPPNFEDAVNFEVAANSAASLLPMLP
jgi:hypothetical protein